MGSSASTQPPPQPAAPAPKRVVVQGVVDPPVSSDPAPPQPPDSTPNVEPGTNARTESQRDAIRRQPQQRGSGDGGLRPRDSAPGAVSREPAASLQSRNRIPQRDRNIGANVSMTAPPPPPSVMTFDLVVDAAGNELTTYVDEHTGQRYFMDWDTLKWRVLDPGLYLHPSSRSSYPSTGHDSARAGTEIQAYGAVAPPFNEARSVNVPASSWRNVSLSHGAFNVAGEGAGGGGEATTATEDSVAGVSGRQGVFRHPTRGPLSTYIFETRRNIRFFFDDITGEWQPMPLAWEAGLPGMQRKLAQMEAILPQWAARDEMLLALRENGYDVQSTINWKMEDMSRSESPAAPVYAAARPAPGHEADKVRILELEVALRSAEDAAAEAQVTCRRLTAELHAATTGLRRQSTYVDGCSERWQALLGAERLRVSELEVQLASHQEQLATVLDATGHAGIRPASSATASAPSLVHATVSATSLIHTNSSPPKTHISPQREASSLLLATTRRTLTTEQQQVRARAVLAGQVRSLGDTSCECLCALDLD